MEHDGKPPTIHPTRYSDGKKLTVALGHLPAAVRESIEGKEPEYIRKSKDVPGEATDLVLMSVEDLQALLRDYELKIRDLRALLAYEPYPGGFDLASELAP